MKVEGCGETGHCLQQVVVVVADKSRKRDSGGLTRYNTEKKQNNRGASGC